ncbi:MAG: polysaccharide biosynthesis/export family protein [Bacteroidales bacterium]|jgi:polysaccharide export outer membrane protein|nr:polysaccharide biosynthesis/export family protein [Bacteroidales bacterium]MDD4214991.1 polysaccharide biosynthesis/export family protein [Bacteroidales bacterium]
MKRLLLLLITILFISGCKIFTPYQMLRQGKYPVSEFQDTLNSKEYLIAPNDELKMVIFSNNGEKVIDPVSSGSGSQLQSGISFMVEFDGQVKLPILDRVKIAGLTLRQAEDLLQERYSKYFNNPYVQLKVTNNRVIIFPGGQGSQAMVVTLDNSNTTLFEALAKAGGINDGKAHKIKLIRGDLKNPKVYIIDLSTVEGMTKANLIVQANDIIYVQPRNKIPEKIINVLAPYLTLLSTFILVYELFVK